MNNYVSDWNLETDLSMNGQKYSTGADHDLVELLWRNGQVVFHSQTHKKQALLNAPNSNNQTWPNANGSDGNSMVIDDNDETVPWILNGVEDSFEKEFCSNFFSELPPCDPINVDKPTTAGSHQMPPPKAVVNSSHCGSNQVANDPDPDPSWVSSSNTGLSAPVIRRAKKDVARGESGKRTEAVEPARTSSSGGSGSSFGRGCKQCTTTTTTSGNTNNKRKNREAEELECQSEPAEFESAGTANKSAQRSGTSRKSRAAEVHNLSERRRRDRINEKMKALQELIPHSNKTDKASMLDEAIEYLKSLQLQLQVMWMGSGGMTPMMFPGLQHYMSRMGMGMAMGPPTAAASMATAMNLPQPRIPVPVVDHPHPAMIVGPTPDQSVLCQAQAFNAMNFQNHPLQNASFPEQYARFMGWNPMQAVSQPMNMFRYNPQTVVQQQGQSIVQQGIISNGPSNDGAPIDSGGGGLGKNIG